MSTGPMSAQYPDAQTMLEFVLAHGLPMQRDGKYRYHGVTEPIWHATKVEAIRAAVADFRQQENLLPLDSSSNRC